MVADDAEAGNDAGSSLMVPPGSSMAIRDKVPPPANAYVIGGNVLAAFLGVLLVGALVLGSIVGVQKQKDADRAEKVAARQEASGDTTGSGTGGTLDASTTGDSTTAGTTGTDATAAAAAGATGTGSTGSGTSGSTSGAGGGAGGGGGGGGGGPAAVAALRPKPGKYEGVAQGQEKTIGGPGGTVQWSGASSEITADGDCWKVKVVFHSRRWSQTRLCPTTDGGLVSTGLLNFNEVELFPNQPGVKTVNTIVCDPPEVFIPGSRQPGTSVKADSCIGTGDNPVLIPGKNQSVGTNTLVGIEDVNGKPAYHLKRDSTVQPVPGTGNTQKGNSDDDWWFSTADGNILKYSRVTEVSTDSPIGPVTFTENGTVTFKV